MLCFFLVTCFSELVYLYDNISRKKDPVEGVQRTTNEWPPNIISTNQISTSGASKKHPDRQHLHFCQFRDDLGIESKNVFSLSLIQIETSMEGSRILVTELPKGINKSDLIIYFQSARDSGGGDVRKIEIEGKQAIVTFEDLKGMYQFIREGRVSLIYSPRLIKSTGRWPH